MREKKRVFDELDGLIGVDDIAELVGVRPLTVRNWATAGRMPPPMRIGTRLRWTRREIQEWILSCRTPAQKNGTESAKAWRSPRGGE